MPVFDSPITTDETNLKKVLGQKLPTLLLLFDSRQKNEPLEDALRREAKKNAGKLLTVRVDVSQNAKVHAEYNNLPTPAIVTITPAGFGTKVKSQAGNARTADLRAHIDHLLNDAPLAKAPLPEAKPTAKAASAPAGKAAHVNDATFKQTVLKSSQPVLVDFWAAWCGPCQVIAPYIDKAAGDYAGKVKVVKLNVDESQITAQQYNVRSIPTFILFKDGQPVQRFSGASPTQIQQMLQEAVSG
ncbi:MAG: thioredoxin [bacterium]|nr:thioredoxin [bacterium]